MGEPPRNPSDRKSENESVQIGELFDEKYRITGKLGGGGMGLVYEAQHEWMERRVALKVLRPNFIAADDYDVFLERFKREAQTASRITHPNAVTIYDFGIFNEMPYLAMQFIEGKTINEIIKESGPFEHARACELLLQTLDAVDAAHALQIIHRDIKPDNIMVSVSPSGVESVHVLDFGIAKVLDTAETNASMTLPGKTVGTPRYMSPEQVLARTIDVRTDIYALGLVLYEMLSGDIPFQADSSMQLMFHHVNTAPLPIRDLNTTALTSKRLEQLVMKALQKDPDKRFQSVSEMKEALQAAMLAAPSKTSISIPSFATAMIPAAIAGNQKKSLVVVGSILGVGLLVVGALAFQPAPEEVDTSDELAGAEADSSLTANQDSSGEASIVASEKQLAALPSSSTSPNSIRTTATQQAKLSSDPSSLEPAAETKPPDSLDDISSQQQLIADNAESRNQKVDEIATATADAQDQENEISVTAESVTGKDATQQASAKEKLVEVESLAEAERQSTLQAKTASSADTGTSDSATSIPATSIPATSDSANSDAGTTTSKAPDSKSAPLQTNPDNEAPINNRIAIANDSSVVAAKARELESKDQQATAQEKSAPPKVETSEVTASKTTPAIVSTPKTTPSKEVDKAKTTSNAKSQVTSDPTSNEVPDTNQSFASTPIPVLIKHLAGEDRTARENAAIELQNRGKAPVPALIETLDNHPSSRARYWAVFILGKLRAVESTESIVRALKDESGMVSETAKKALRAVNPSRADTLLGPSQPTNQPPKNEGEKKPSSGFLGIF